VGWGLRKRTRRGLGVELSVEMWSGVTHVGFNELLTGVCGIETWIKALDCIAEGGARLFMIPFARLSDAHSGQSDVNESISSVVSTHAM
jgi:hypothetical protein